MFGKKPRSYVKDAVLSEDIRNTPAPPSPLDKFNIPSPPKRDSIASQRSGLTVNVSVTETDLFKDIVELLRDVYGKSDGELKQHIKDEFTRILGRTHDVDGILAGRYKRGD